MTGEQIKEFLGRLEGPEGCNFTNSGWRCGGVDKPFSRAILNKMGIPHEEAEEFLDKCEELGGYCDCEILLNSAAQLEGGGYGKAKKTPKV